MITILYPYRTTAKLSLLIGAKWLNRYEDINDYSDPLPEIGKFYDVELDRQEEYGGSYEYLLWSPPFADLNGYGVENANDFLTSYIIGGYLLKSESNNYHRKFKVNEIFNFYDYLCVEEGKEYSKGLLQMWDKPMAWVDHCQLGDFVYMEANGGNGYALSCILWENSEKVYLLYHSYTPDACWESVVTSYELTNIELEIYKKLMRL